MVNRCPRAGGSSGRVSATSSSPRSGSRSREGWAHGAVVLRRRAAVDPGGPRHEPLPMDGSVVPALLDAAFGRLPPRGQLGQGRYGGSAWRLGEHFRRLRYRQHGATTVSGGDGRRSTLSYGGVRTVCVERSSTCARPCLKVHTYGCAKLPGLKVQCLQTMIQTGDFQINLSCEHI